MEEHRETRRFVMIPKVAHPWFEEVRRGALAQARLLQDKVGAEITVDYVPPAEAGVTLQDSLLAEAAATNPSGILIDPVDVIAKMPAMAATRDSGIPVVVFDSPAPDPAFTSVGNDFSEQGGLAARRLVELIGGTGEVAVMQGFPTAPNHRQRYEAQLGVLREHPGITVVDGGVDNDSIEQAAEGMRIPQQIDTGIDLITAANVDDFLAAYRRRKADGGP